MRPDVTDAFLPIAAAIQLKAILSIDFGSNSLAGAVMLVTAVVTGIVCSAFCGWICPLGLGLGSICINYA